MKRLTETPTVQDGTTTPVIQDVIRREKGFPRRQITLMAKDTQGVVTTLIDTGSTLNVLHPKIAKKLKAVGAEVVDQKVRYDTASGQGVPPYHLWVTVVIQDIPFGQVRSHQVCGSGRRGKPYPQLRVAKR